ncbi:MAG: leucine-rich repeat protein [Paraprevotella clara]|nr:leucine-rich repeat protein [Paraprevotella clara]
MKNLRLCWAAFGLCVSLGVSAQRGSCGTGVSWALADGTLTISGEGNMTDFSDPRYGSSNLPSWDIYKNNITKVVIEGGVKHVGDNAFYGYSTLQEVILEEGIKTIGSASFNGCSGLKSVDFPSSLRLIGGYYDEDGKTQFGFQGAFVGCSGLTVLEIPSTVCGVGRQSFMSCSNLKTLYWNVANYTEDTWLSYSNFTRGMTGYGPFEDCPIEEVTFGNEVDSIPSGLLRRCGQLSKVHTSGSVKYVGPEAFHDTYWISSLPEGVVYVDKVAYSYKGSMMEPTVINIKEGTESVTDYAFQNQTYLTKAIIPSGLTYLGKDAFAGCRSLGEVEWNAEECRDFESCPFADALSFVTFGDAVRRIPAYMFQGCTGLFEVNLPVGLLEIGDDAFYGCEGLSEIVIPETVEKIGRYAFSGCSNITHVTIPENVTYLGDASFYNCEKLSGVSYDAVNCKDNRYNSTTFPPFYGSPLQKITIGDKVERLPAMIASWQKLGEVVIPNSVRTIGEKAFYNSQITSLTVGENIDSIGNQAFLYCEGLTEVRWNARSAGNINFSSTDKLFPKSLKTVVLGEKVESIPAYFCHACTDLETVTCSASIKKIGEAAFEGCSKLIGFSFPETLQEIGNSAFEDCASMTELFVPNSVTAIGERAFSGCSGLAKAVIGEGVSFIGKSSLSGCSGLVEVHWNAIRCADANKSILNNSLNKIIFGDKVEHIPAYLCYKCSNVQDITLPETLVSVGENAFYGCMLVEKLEIPASCKFVGDYAFRGMGLQSLFIPSTIESLGIYAFSNNKNLEWVVIAKDPFQHPNGLFNSCDKLQAIYLPDGINFYENYGWSYYGDKVRSMVAFDDNYIYTGKGVELSCTLDMPQGYDIKDWVPGDQPVNVGEYDISNTFTVEGTHQFEFHVDLHCIIWPKELSVKAKDCTKVYGEKNPEFELEYDGFVEGEDASVLTELPVVSCDATETSVADTIYGYPIYLSGGKADNYTFIFTGPGKLYIAPASQFITWEQDLSNLYVGDKVALEASSTSGQLVTFGLAEGDEELAMLHWSDGIGTLECLGEGTVTLTAYQYSSDRNYKNAEPVVKILTISKADGIGAEKVSSMEVYGLHGHIRVRGMKAGLPLRVYTSDGVLLHEETCDGSNMDLAVPCSGLYLVKAGDKTVKLIVK